jgi:MFS family permease
VRAETPELHRRHADAVIDGQIRRSLRYSVLDAASFSVMLGASESYFQAFAVFLKGTVFQVGIVYTVPIFVASCIQLFSQAILRRVRSRKRLAVGAGLARTFLFLPLLFVFFMGPLRVWILLAIICLYFALNYLPISVWTSWMRDLVEDSRRGAFFSRRNATANLVALAAIVVAGLILEALQERELFGFITIFALALLGSLGSYLFLRQKYEAPYRAPERPQEGLLSFTAGLLRSNYGRFVLLNVLLYFGVFLAGPFFVPYMLNSLQLSYFRFMVATSLVVLVKFLTMPLWGELGDRYGNRRILTLATLLIGLAPLGWLVSRTFLWICLVQALGGLAWAGFDIASLNFAYDVLPEEKVSTHTSYLIFLRGLAIFAGGLLGGVIVQRFRLFGSPYYGIFGLSGVVRLAVALPLLLLLKEERPVEHISYRHLMVKLISIGPRRGLQLLLLGRPRKEPR